MNAKGSDSTFLLACFWLALIEACIFAFMAIFLSSLHNYNSSQSPSVAHVWKPLTNELLSSNK